MKKITKTLFDFSFYSLFLLASGCTTLNTQQPSEPAKTTTVESCQGLTLAFASIKGENGFYTSIEEAKSSIEGDLSKCEIAPTETAQTLLSEARDVLMDIMQPGKITLEEAQTKAQERACLSLSVALAHQKIEQGLLKESQIKEEAKKAEKDCTAKSPENSTKLTASTLQKLIELSELQQKNPNAEDAVYENSYILEREEENTSVVCYVAAGNLFQKLVDNGRLKAIPAQGLQLLHFYQACSTKPVEALEEIMQKSETLFPGKKKEPPRNSGESFIKGPSLSQTTGRTGQQAAPLPALATLQ